MSVNKLRTHLVRHTILAFLFCILCTSTNGNAQTDQNSARQAPAANPKHIVILAGPITGHPKNTHEYEKSSVLIKHLLDHSKVPGIKTTVVFDGWPSDSKLLDTADTIVMISDGGDRDESQHPLYNGDRMKVLENQMNRGCGLVQFHWSTFNPSRFHDKITEWVGGYFDYEKGTATNKWYSAIKHYTEPIRLGDPRHPISNGVKPFRLREEFYYRIRFREDDPRLKRIVQSKPTGETKEFTVGWAVERKDGGRGFGFTGGHYYMNWWDSNFRKLILNAIVWTAGAEVPRDGVTTQLEEPTKALIVTGYNHPAHLWRKTTAALIQVIENDPRILVDVTEDPEFLANEKLSQYDVIVMNYSSWDRNGLSQKARKGFTEYLKNGGGLSVIHFANGSWTDTLPNKESDWPEYRTKIVRRVWVHGTGNSGHDAFGDFRVTKTEIEHPITNGLRDFPTKDELYYRQKGPLPIEPLVTAVSRDTKKAEPMAWAYRYEKANVFQTVLGHADVSVLMAGDLIRRGTAWAAGLKNLSFDPPVERKLPYLWRSGAQWSPKSSEAKAKPKKTSDQSNPKQPNPTQPKLVQGKFGKALNAKGGGVLGATAREIQEPNLTVECWIKMNSSKNFNIIAASETKSSLRHWELYTYSNTGFLSVYMPGIFGEIKSAVNVCDGKWHYVAMTFEKQFIKLYVDGKQVKKQPINYRKHPETREGFSIGSLVEKTIHCDGAIDELRLSNEIKNIDSIPTKPFEIEPSTIGLWRFNELSKEGRLKDYSKKKNDLATQWTGVTPRKVTSSKTGPPKKVTGHWGEDAVGFRWTEKDSEDNRWAFTKHGRFLASTIPLPGGFAEKGLVIKVGDTAEDSVCYDLKRSNLMAGWSGGFLEFNQARFGLIRHLKPVGNMLFHNQPGMGWEDSKQKKQAELRYRGLYTQDERVLLEYSVGDLLVQESPWLEKVGQTRAVTREFGFGKIKSQVRVPLFVLGKVKNAIEFADQPVSIQGYQLGDDVVAAAVVSKDSNHEIQVQDGHVWLVVKKTDQKSLAKVLIWRGKKNEVANFKKLIAQTQVKDPSRFKKAGERKWTQTVTTRGVVGEQEGLGYAVDTIRLPFRNPYDSLFFVSGHDWLNDGKMLVSTVHGEVWIAENVDSKLDKVIWKRFATGLYQPLGIRVVNNQIYVLCRDQIVRLHDRDGNDEADYYECFHADVTTSTGVHDYVCCLDTDRDGNFYYIHANDGVVRVSPDGDTKTIVATGFRNPNGMGVRSDGLVTAAPQEGEWTPASAVCEVIEGRHYGYRGPKQKTQESPLGYEKPLVFLPRLIDNSSGGQFWTESDHWGILDDRLFHLSYGKCTMHLVLRDELPLSIASNNLTTQGAIVPFPFVFESGVCRGRMNPHDGQLYVSGLKGWTTAAVRDGSIQRVRFVKEKIDQTFCPDSYKVFANGIELGFTQPIDPTTINSASFSVQAWNYRYSKNYGSPEFKLSNPNQQGRDSWRVKSAKLTNGNRKVFLEIPQIQVADQVAIKIKLASQSATFDSEIYATIKQKRIKSIVPGKPFDPALARFESRLQPGVVVESLGLKKSSLAYFDSSPEGGVKLVAWLKLESTGTQLLFQPGDKTKGQVRFNLLSNDVALSDDTVLDLDPSKPLEIPLGSQSGYCRLEVELDSDEGPIQLRTLWKSNDFVLEPIPSRNLFMENNWLTEIATGDSAKKFAARNLVLDNNCHRCHQLSGPNTNNDYRVNRSLPDLLQLNSRRTRSYVMRKILEPHFEGHGSRMPGLVKSKTPDGQQSTEDLVAFLMSGRSQSNKSIEASAKKIETGEKLYEQLGCIGCHHLPFDSNKDSYDRLSLKYTAQKFTASGLRQFLLDPQRHSPHRKMGNFGLSSDEAECLSQFIEKYSTEAISAPKSNRNIAGNPTRGKKRFRELGCANCHNAGEQMVAKMSAIEQVDSGCLTSGVKVKQQSGMPSFELTQTEIRLLKWYLTEIQSGGTQETQFVDAGLDSTPVFHQANRLMSELRCQTCHSTHAGSAKLPEIILDEGVLGLNPERLPDLTQVGSKLKTGWMKEFLAGRNQSTKLPGTNEVRPWLKTRMPKFGGQAQVLAHGMTQNAGLKGNQSSTPEPIDRKLAETGFHLAGQARGLDCRQCHGVGKLPPRGDEKTQIVLGVNFSLVKERLRREYYDRWMIDPLRIDPQTKMPKYSADGKTTKIQGILGGDADRQYKALWQYLLSVAEQARE